MILSGFLVSWAPVVAATPARIGRKAKREKKPRRFIRLSRWCYRSYWIDLGRVKSRCWAPVGQASRPIGEERGLPNAWNQSIPNFVHVFDVTGQVAREQPFLVHDARDEYRY